MINKISLTYQFFLCFPNHTDQPVVDDLRKLCLSKEDFNVLNTIGRGHFGQVPCNKGLSKLLARQT